MSFSDNNDKNLNIIEPSKFPFKDIRNCENNEPKENKCNDKNNQCEIDQNVNLIDLHNTNENQLNIYNPNTTNSNDVNVNKGENLVVNKTNFSWLDCSLTCTIPSDSRDILPNNSANPCKDLVRDTNMCMQQQQSQQQKQQQQQQPQQQQQ